MPVPSITLANGWVLLTEGESPIGLISMDGKSQFGYVEAVYSTSSFLVVTDHVVFNKDDGKQILYGSTSYILIREKDIALKE